MLCNLTSKRVLCTPLAGGKKFLTLTQLFPSLTEQNKEKIRWLTPFATCYFVIFYVILYKILILTRERHAEHQFAGQNTQQLKKVVNFEVKDRQVTTSERQRQGCTVWSM